MRLTIALLAALLGTPAAAAELDYHHWAESNLAMIFMDLFESHANVISLGESSTPGIHQYAMLISKTAATEDSGDRNVVVFECGMHAREWYASESCYWLMERFYFEADEPGTVSDLLDVADVWFIPHTNPAGRDLDDLNLGDPTDYAWVCKGGTDGGDPCVVDGDCSGGGTCYETGWRTNANRSVCDVGVDLARNWSSGWTSAAATCTTGEFMKYRGPDPFSEAETLNLRRFLHNRLVSTVVIQHANGHETYNRWYTSSTAAAYVTDQLAAINAAGSASYSPDPSMPVSSVGGSVGQFSAWLTEKSNVTGELDEDTERNIQTFFLELPIKGSSYGPPYENVAGDGSNGFHPSDTCMETLWGDAIEDMLIEVIHQTRSPGCPVDAAGNLLTAHCPTEDFGLVGAKIADATDTVGLLDYNATTREETLVGGTHEIVFSVQNFSADVSNTTSTATVTVTKNGVVEATYTVPISLAQGDRGVYNITHTFTGGLMLIKPKYRVDIELDADDFTKNDDKRFAFRVNSRFGFVRVPGRVVFDPIQVEWAPLRFHAEFVRVPLFDPTDGVIIRVHPHLPRWPIPPFPVESTVLVVPGGAGWAPLPGGGWRFDDPQAQQGVRHLRLKPQGGVFVVDLETAPLDTEALAAAPTRTVDVGLVSTDVRLNAVEVLDAPMPPQRPMPAQWDQDIEDEPGW